MIWYVYFTVSTVVILDTDAWCTLACVDPLRNVLCMMCDTRCEILDACSLTRCVRCRTPCVTSDLHVIWNARWCMMPYDVLCYWYWLGHRTEWRQHNSWSKHGSASHLNPNQPCSRPFFVQMLSQLSIYFITCPSAPGLLVRSSSALTWKMLRLPPFVKLDNFSNPPCWFSCRAAPRPAAAAAPAAVAIRGTTVAEGG